MSATVASEAVPSRGAALFAKHEFAIRRLHSLLGVVPLGLYMVVHLTTNASMLNGSETFQRAVYLIHSPGKLLPLIEWGGIFFPLLFHAGIGIWITKTARLNNSSYKFVNNKRYAWQRITGVIALVYLFFHVLHLHGWFHADAYLALIRPLGFGAFRPYNAASSLVYAMEGYFWPAFYLIGVWACVYHLANGIWTAGITWGIWISPEAQARATKFAVVIGMALAVIGTGAWWGVVSPGEEQFDDLLETEKRMYAASVEAGLISPNDHKLYEEGDVPFEDAADEGEDHSPTAQHSAESSSSAH
ncbi:MAG: succinate dehydrogenase cytochrome b558 subunit [Planctomycetota bacterium]